MPPTLYQIAPVILPSIVISALYTDLFHSFNSPLNPIYYYYSSVKYEDTETERFKTCSSTQNKTGSEEGRTHSHSSWLPCPHSEPLCSVHRLPLPRKGCVTCALSVWKKQLLCVQEENRRNGTTLWMCGEANCQPILTLHVGLACPPRKWQNRDRENEPQTSAMVAAPRFPAYLGLMVTLVRSFVVTTGGKCFLNPPALAIK